MTLATAQAAHDAADDGGPARTCEWCDVRSHSVRTRTYAAHGLRRTITACADCYDDWTVCHGDALRELEVDCG